MTDSVTAIAAFTANLSSLGRKDIFRDNVNVNQVWVHRLNCLTSRYSWPLEIKIRPASSRKPLAAIGDGGGRIRLCIQEGGSHERL